MTQLPSMDPTIISGNKLVHTRKFRPNYPEQLFDDLFRYLQETRNFKWERAVDVGTGSGQVALPLSEKMKLVIGIDRSSEQLRYAYKRPNIEYRTGNAYPLDFPANSIDLVTAGQCAHWFDCERFFNDMPNVLRHSSGVCAVMGYTMLQLKDPSSLAETFEKYKTKLEPFWDERAATSKSCSGCF
eukprot:34280_1